MTTELINNDDALRRAIKASLPEPGAEYGARLNDALASLREGDAPRAAIGLGSIMRRRPLLAAALILLLLALTAGAAFAAGSLIHNVFGKAKTDVEQSMEDFKEQYQEAREQMEHMSTEEAAVLDNELDYRSESLLGMLATAKNIEEHAVEIGQGLGELALMQFASYDYLGMDPNASRFLYFGTTAALDAELPSALTLTVDGVEFEAGRMQMELEPTETEQYAIYECWFRYVISSLPEKSIITVSDGENEVCFRYDWAEEKAELPKDEAQLARWLEEAEAAQQALRDLRCVCKYPVLTTHGLTVELTSIVIEGNELVINGVITAEGEALNTKIRECAFKFDSFRADEDFTVIRPKHIDHDFTDGSTETDFIFRMTLPYDMNSLRGRLSNIQICISVKGEEISRTANYNFSVKFE